MPPVIGAIILAGAGYGTQQRASKKAEKRQRQLIEHQERQTAAAEAAAAKAEEDAISAATKKLKQKRLAQTKTVFTTPLGVLTEPSTGQARLLGSLCKLKVKEKSGYMKKKKELGLHLKRTGKI